MTAEELIAEQSQRHHAAIQQITQVMGQTQLDVKQTQGDVKRILDLLGGTIDGKPGMVHRLAAVEAAQAKMERVTPEEQRALWWRERKTKIVDVILVTIVVGGLSGLLLLGVRGFIRDAVKDLSVVSPRNSARTIDGQRDPLARYASTP